MTKNILIVEARFYEDMADSLAEGALAVLQQAGCQVERISVPGVLEVPVAIKYAADSNAYDGYVALGVVIRGETTHYEIVCNESARALMELGIKDQLSIGNGIQTVENSDQAWARCKMSEKDKGGGAAKATLALMGLRDSWS